MEKRLVIQLDTSVLIDYFRKTKKSNTFFVALADHYDHFVVSVITRFEIYVGCTEPQKTFWDKVFENITVLPLDSASIDTAVKIDMQLRKISKQIDFPDLLIASTAVTNELPLATLNAKHFNRIAGLEVISK